MTRQEKLIKLASMMPILEAAQYPSYLPGQEFVQLFKEAVLLNLEITLEGQSDE